MYKMTAMIIIIGIEFDSNNENRTIDSNCLSFGEWITTTALKEWEEEERTSYELTGVETSIFSSSLTNNNNNNNCCWLLYDEKEDFLCSLLLFTQKIFNFDSIWYNVFNILNVLFNSIDNSTCKRCVCFVKFNKCRCFHEDRKKAKKQIVLSMMMVMKNALPKRIQKIFTKIFEHIATQLNIEKQQFYWILCFVKWTLSPNRPAGPGTEHWTTQ